MKQKKALFTIFIILNIFTAFAEAKQTYAQKHIEIALRAIGHKLLLTNYDSTSRVLPIQKLKENHYQISFETDIYFITDSLINLVDRQLKATNLPNEYIVSILNCSKSELVFGYEVSKKKGDILPCTGRIQPKGCYLIQVEFLDENAKNNLQYLWLFVPFALVAIIFSRNLFSKKLPNKMDENQSVIHFGNMIFDPESNVLKFENQKIELSEKEIKLLIKFIEKPNKTVERELLIKEIWEDEGVIVVSRSLDVLVSKLRKKLEADSSLKLVNVHGKGYKMTIS